MTRAFVTCLGLAAALLASCVGAPPPPTPPTARIVVFTASDERVPRGTEVTLLWQAADAGVQDGFPSCVLTRRFGDEATETPVQATCAGSATEIPSAPVTAATVEYRFQVLKRPHDPADPYLTETRSVTLDPALYAIRAGGPGSVHAQGVSTVADGGALVAGDFAGTAAFGAVTLFTSGGVDAFVARADPDGTWAWATGVAGTGAEQALSVSAIPDGSAVADGGAIVAGRFTATAGFGPTLLTTAGIDDVFVARVAPDGSWAWATRGGGTGADVATAVSALADGGAVVAGSIGGAATASFGPTTLASAGDDDVFVAGIDADGAWTWATRGGGTGVDVALGVATLLDGGAIVAGYFTGSATFGTTTLTSSGDLDAFVARIDPDGTWAWATRAGGVGTDAATAVASLADGGAIVAGYVTGSATFGTTTLTSVGETDAFVARIAPDGTWAWARRAGGPFFDQAFGVATLADGGAIVAGGLAGTATFGAITLVGGASDDVFVARIDGDGSWTWVRRAGGGSSVDRAVGVGVLGDGGAVVTGTITGTATFGSTTLTSTATYDTFVARIGADGAW